MGIGEMTDIGEGKILYGHLPVELIVQVLDQFLVYRAVMDSGEKEQDENRQGADQKGRKKEYLTAFFHLLKLMTD
jgi:hypothetical protein